MKAYDILLWISFIIAGVIVLWYLFSNPEPTLEQALLIVLVSLLFATYGNVREMKGNLRAVHQEISAIKERLSTVEQSFASITAKRTRG